jgi:ribosomal protein L20
MFQLDLWEKAAECQRALEGAESNQRQILTDVRDLWIGLANARNFLTGAEFDQQIKTLDSIQADLIKPATIKIH